MKLSIMPKLKIEKLSLVEQGQLFWIEYAKEKSLAFLGKGMDAGEVRFLIFLNRTSNNVFAPSFVEIEFPDNVAVFEDDYDITIDQDRSSVDTRLDNFYTKPGCVILTERGYFMKVRRLDGSSSQYREIYYNLAEGIVCFSNSEIGKPFCAFGKWSINLKKATKEQTMISPIVMFSFASE